MKQKIVIQVQMTCEKCRTKALKIAAQTTGVTSLAIQGSDRDQVAVVGEGIDSTKLAVALRKKVGFANIVSVQEDKPSAPQKKPAAIEAPNSDMVIQPYLHYPTPTWQMVYDPAPRDPCSIM